MTDPVRIGLVGCGAISGAYLKMARRLPVLEVTACADLNREAAAARAREFHLPRVCEVEELLADDSIEIVLNLTVPKAHVPVALEAVARGKHVYLEKPLGVTRAEGEQLLAAARRAEVRVGCAPDTFLGAGLQTARQVIDTGGIGRPVAFLAFMMGPGHESWHPNPRFFYETGGGPMFDMGPYYLTALLNLLGPVRRLSGAASIAIPERVVTSQPHAGERIRVETPDHVCGILEFEGGAAGTLVTSFAAQHPVHDRTFPITVFGTEGTLKVPDPNGFDGPVQVRRRGEEAWADVPHAFVTGYGRAIGLADMAAAIRAGEGPHRASGEQAFAVLDLMQGFLDSSRDGRHYAPVAAYERPAPMPADGPLLLAGE